MEQTAIAEIVKPRESISIDVIESISKICHNPFYMVFREMVDMMFASFVIFLFLPIFPILYLLIKMDSTGPIFFCQRRIGKDNRIFSMYKFRTMYTDAEEQTGPVWSNQNDPRITRVGRWLRRTYIDELPQCLNIFVGDMGLVGPRPERPEFMEEFEELVPGFSRRCAVKPGITGLAQVSCSYKMLASDIRNKLAYDMFYIRKQCCVLDLKIILRTVKFLICSCLR